MPSPDAARMAVTRALKRLMEHIRKVERKVEHAKRLRR
jgi:hypothetical protein